MSTIERVPTVAVTPSRYMTEAEFEAWCDEDIRAEWVNGEVIVHMPATARHSEVGIWLGTLLRLFVDQRNLGRIFNSELQISMPGIRRVPDLCFIAAEHTAIVKQTRIEGAPDLIMEIVSRDSVERDWRDKYLEYEAMGVREYWVIDLDYQRLRAYHLSADGRYAAMEEQDGKLYSQVLNGFWVRAADVWQDPLPNTLAILKELGVVS